MGAHRILFDICDMVHVVQTVLDAVLLKASFPYVELAFETERETSSDVLHGLFERDVFG